MELNQQLKTLPRQTGVYIFKDSKGQVLYVGKAKVLKNRVRSYFVAGTELDPAKKQMVEQVADIETITTDNETEALVLEANLIRQHQPPYNVVLRDDKFYLFIKITNEEFPRIFPVRRLKRDGARYFGPYSSAKAVRATLRLLRRLFPFRGEKETPREKIFPHPLFKASSANTKQTYRQNIQNIIRFLQGKRGEIANTLQAGMRQAAKAKQYEQAAIFRDQLKAIERMEGSQKVFLPQQESFDVVSIAQAAGRSAGNVFSVRDGKLLNKNTFLLRHRSTTSAEDVLRQFILQYYRVAQDIPKIILLPFELSDNTVIASWMSKNQQPVLTVPRRGKKRQLLQLGELNAQQLLTEEEAQFSSNQRLKQASQILAKLIGLSKKTLKRVETYDISNIQGKLATASMIVFAHGQPQRNLYRKFRIKIAGKAFDQALAKPNDYAMIQEALRRRFSNRHPDWPLPDLIVIDGGKGQLSAAKQVLDELAIKVMTVALAKREEEIFLTGKKKPIRLPYDSDALYLIQRMRDEAHRFTVSYHRLLRSKQQRRSILDEVPGIGPKTKKKLLRHFGSLKSIRSASEAKLEEVIGKFKAKTLKDYL